MLLASGAGWSAAAATTATGPTLSWTSATPATSPPPLAYATEAYDPASSEVVLFGGETAQNTLSDDTWVWNGSTWARAPAAQSPPARELASMAYDRASGRLILFGGQDQKGNLLSDTWAWNGASWVQVNANGPAPGPREAAALAYSGSGLLLFGGTGAAAASNASTSTSVAAAGAPAATSQTVLGDTWRWTLATGWVQVPAPGPAPRSGASMAFDQENGSTILFGGESTATSAATADPLGDTWVWNGAGWGQAKPATSPPARYAAVMDDFTSLGGPVLFGGEAVSGGLSDAWLWNGTDWARAAVNGAAPRSEGTAGAFAPQGMVLFGGVGSSGPLGETGILSAVAPKPVATTVASSTTTTGSNPPPSPGTPHSSPTTKPNSNTHRPAATRPGTTVTTGATGTGQVGSPTIQADQHKVERGDSVQLTGAGFAPGSIVIITFHSTPTSLGSALVGLNGTFSKVVTIPAGAAAGQHHFVASGTTTTGGSTNLSTAVTVFVPGGKRTPTITTLALVGLAILIPVAAYLGMAGVGARRRRQHGA